MKSNILRIFLSKEHVSCLKPIALTVQKILGGRLKDSQDTFSTSLP